jgi:type IV pilus assembly protein PilM
MLKQERILTLDIGASGIKMAEFVGLKSGGVELVNYAVGSMGLDPQSEGDRKAHVTATIRELLQERGIKPGPVLVSVSGQSVFLRFVKLPPVDKEKVYQIILYEAQQNVPFPIEEVVWDYQLVGGQSGEIDVMLAAIKAEIVEEITQAVEEAGLDPDLVDVAPMALYNAVRFNYSDLPECTLVVDIGARSTDLIFIEEGRVFSRSVPVAGNAITQQVMHEFGLSFADAEDLKRAHAFVAFGGAYEGPRSEVVDKVSKSVRSVMTRLHVEINRSINFYRSQQSGRQPGLVLLTGGTSVIPYTDTFLKDKMQVEVDFLNPFLNVAVSDHIDADEVAKVVNVMGQVVGLSLRKSLTCPIELNLMPPRLLKEKQFQRKQPVFISAALCVVLILLVWCGYFVRMATLGGVRLEKIQQRVAQLEQIESRLADVEEQYKEVSRQVARLTDLIGQRTQWLRIVDAVYSQMLPGMWLTELKPVFATAPAPEGAPEAAAKAERGALEGVEIAGMGYRDKHPSTDVVRALRDRLRSLEMFSSERTEITWQPTPAPDDFAIQFRLRVALKEPVDL